MNLINLRARNSKAQNLKPVLLIITCLWLSGCSTVDGFLSGGLNDPANVKAAEEAKMTDQEVISEPVMDETKQAIDQQDMRLERVEGALSQLALQQRSIVAELEIVKTEKAEKEAQLLEQTAKIAAMENAADDPLNNDLGADGLGLHLTSYLSQESIEAGRLEIKANLPQDLQNKQMRITKATIKGNQYHRLLVGPFDNYSDAEMACAEIQRRYNYCNIVPFKGELLK